MPEDRPSMADLARVVGISTNAVSLALAGRPGVSEATRMEVRRVAKEIGYEPRIPRRVANRLKTVALVFNEGLLYPPAALFFGPVLERLQRELSALDATLLVFGISDAEEKAMRLPGGVNTHPIDGIVALSRFVPEFIDVMQRRAPVVVVDHYDPGHGSDQVLTENERGALLAVKHLVHLGHRDFGFLGRLHDSPSYTERWRGYLAGILAAKDKARSLCECLDAEDDIESLRKFFVGIEQHPTAWFCANDVVAVNLLQLCQEASIRVPEQVSVVGFDDVQLAQSTTPPLTSVHVDAQAYAQRVVAALVHRISHPDAPIEVVRIVPTLAIRGSTAKPDRAFRTEERGLNAEQDGAVMA